MSQEQPGEQRGPCSGTGRREGGRAELVPAAPWSPAPGSQLQCSGRGYPFSSFHHFLRQKARIYRLRQGLVSELGIVPSESSRSRTSARMGLAPTSGVLISSLPPRGGLCPSLQRGQTGRQGEGEVLNSCPRQAWLLQRPVCLAPTPQPYLLQRQSPPSL